ncbi:hypothetical protein CEUSTIGMA_g3856.t1 [Chlamydomonas eustigma]|uniref:Reverse transcriptase domain-containing protein n=1 Tax=Chlamydomonas eustigma TaxID=1157962 RepID=A0A250X008_9CHLO|nr:hypothetical protein CEUSTIGMA_g3856.t1 [Chlamydomonas eustigma]|eukprot:GAX76411.1 hypothetical protein CEUSTIGMA_g3856.t1 [Chlamydomonas eustigma]
MQEPLSPEEEARRTLQFLVEENARLHQIVASIENKSDVALATASVASETLNKIVAPAGIGPQQFRPLPSSLKLQPLTPFEGERGSNEDVDAWLFKAESMFAMCGVTDENICIEYAGQALIGNAIKNAYPLPSVQDILDRLNGATVFSKMDLAQAYYQVRVAPKSQHLTAFRCRYGLFEWKVMPLGLCNAPATFQRLIMDVLRPYLDDFVMPYLDDLLIFSKNDEEHLEHLEKVLVKLREHKLYARPKKCEFGKRRMKFLGHYVQCVDGKTTQICVDPEKIKAVQDWPRPTTQKEVLQFKGLAEFYRRFIKNFSDISAPLSALTGNAKWEWGTAQENAFTRLKTALTQALVLATPDYSKPFVVFVVTCDASGYAVGAVLSQGDGDDVRVIAYESRKMTDVETRYPIHDKELLAVIHALKKWGYHLRGKKFVIVTDNWATYCKLPRPLARGSPELEVWRSRLVLLQWPPLLPRVFGIFHSPSPFPTITFSPSFFLPSTNSEAVLLLILGPFNYL